MRSGWFQTQINESAEVFSLAGLLDEQFDWPDYSSLVADARSSSYFDHWLNCFADKTFDLRLTDLSIIQFNSWVFEETAYLSYSYLECPLRVDSYEEFIAKEFPGEQVPDYVDFHHEYETYVLTCDRKELMTPMRYDFAPKDYRAGAHPASHLHLGEEDGMRIGLHKILKPVSFALLILRQKYLAPWENLILRSEAMELWEKYINADLDSVSGKYIDKMDYRELMLHHCSC